MPDERPGINSFLILRAQLGDREAFDKLLPDVAAGLRPYLRRLLGNESDAEDALQDTLVLIWKRLYQLTEPRAFWAWAYRIASREGRRMIRQTNRRAVTIDRFSDHVRFTTSGAASEAIDPDTLEQFMEHISRLPPNTRDVILLHYQEGFSLRVIGAIMRSPTGTVKSRLNAGLRALRDALEEP